jgi:tRNA (guanine37-N1)-methyltransferase
MNPLRIDIITLFPEMFAGWLEFGGVARARERGLVSVELTGLRQFGIGRHLQVDDYPFGGGAGMVLKPEPLFAAVESIPDAAAGPIVLLSPRGHIFDQKMAESLAQQPRITLIAGHYEGVDERVSEHLVTHEVSIGDYVLSGGEPAAMVVGDAVCRLLPGAIDSQSTIEESFNFDLLEYPQYTRPAQFREWEVPDVLVSGNHGKIAEWRRARAEERTRTFRPDIMERRVGDSSREA